MFLPSAVRFSELIGGSKLSDLLEQPPLSERRGRTADWSCLAER